MSWEHTKRGVKKALRVALWAILVVILVHGIHAATFDRIVVYNEIEFSSSNIPAQLDGYKIAFITDIHAATDRRLQSVVEQLESRQIDLLLLGGDFAWDKDALGQTLDLLTQINTTDGIYGVEGNHDQYDTLFAAMEARGITPLSNSGLYIQDGFFLAGVEDLWNRNPDVTESIREADPNSFILLISHNPDVSMEQDTTDVDLILSGHTHNGQVNFFGLWSLGLDSRVISEYGEKFDGGWAESRDGTPVYVCSGIGEFYPRVFARPEVTFITLVHE